MVEVLGYDLPLLDIDENGTIYLKTKRWSEKHKYKLKDNLLLQEVLWCFKELLEKSPDNDMFYILRIEPPALAYLVRFGVFRGNIKRKKAQQLSRLVSDLFVVFYFKHERYIGDLKKVVELLAKKELEEKLK